MKPVAIDLCCGLGGWTQGLLSEGWDVIGFDIERHEYGDRRYPAELILKSILEINGYDLRAVNPALVVASPPCQEYSYMAMPWSRAKQIAGALRGEVPFPEEYTGSRTVEDLTALYWACFRIAQQAGCPIVVENVVGAQAWVGKANAHYGSFYLWGDVGNVAGRVVRADRAPRFGEYVAPRSRAKVAGQNWSAFNETGEVLPHWRMQAEALKTVGHANRRDGFDHTRHLTNQWESDAIRAVGVKQGGSGEVWFDKAVDERRRQASAAIQTGGDWFGPYDAMKAAGTISATRPTGKHSKARKAASAMIAEIPFPLAQHIARVFKPR